MLTPNAVAQLKQATEYEVVDKDNGLINGLYIMLGDSGKGKTLASWTLASSLRQPVDAIMINESHAPHLSFEWLIGSFLRPDAGLFAEYAELFKDSNALGDAQAKRFISTKRQEDFESDVVLFDSATFWMWQAEKVEYSIKVGDAAVLMGKSSTKTGGLTGELIEFLMMADRACVAMGKCVIWTINISQYPVTSSKDINNTSKIFNLFKGITSGVMMPNLRKNGASGIEVSDRTQRDNRTISLRAASLNNMAEMLGMVTHGQTGHKPKTGHSPINLKKGRA
jgi:hypothetical protein